MRRTRLVAALAALSFVSAGCGARLTAEQRDLALRGAAGPVTSSGTVTGGQPSARPLTGGQTGPAGGPAGPAAGPSSGPVRGGVAAPRPGATTGPVAGGPAASPACAVPDGKGGATAVGVTPDSITLANVADISGPVPGIFESARQAVTAFAAYWNATYGGVCGRKLKTVNYDSRTDANGHREAYLRACETAFAAVGSMSAFDHGGAAVAEQCGIVDVAAVPVTPEHQNAKTTYGAAGQKAGTISSTLPRFIQSTYPGAQSKAAYLYLDAGASAIYAEANIRAYEAYGHGWKFVYREGIDVSTFNYAPYVQKMKDLGVRYVQFLGSYQHAAKLALAMRDQGFKPDMFLMDPTAYNPEFVKQGGSAVEGAYVFTDAVMFEEAAGNPELRTYLTWLDRVAPGAQPSYFGLYAWSAARLFVTEAAAVGPNLTRKAVLDRLERVDNWTGNGLHSPQHVGPKMTPECWAFLRLQGGRWHRAHPSNAPFACNPLTSG